ncbi:MAG TPA: lysophospholipid acyltransferase family protein [bacterium]|jgi:1-acyl-sn-glycerol-3-phosphate acyltransferase|nr:lysophospholipid acyltransferase family protein [bacterium]HOG37935.1 lysophospholipid acyltransferase family protein [bacterium]HQI02993.1 lysophospholipid acyltransferase family protein [bacterium]
MIYWILKYTIGTLIRLVWVRSVKGIENIPKKGPFVICANHSSYFDFLTLIAVCPRRIYFLAGEVFFQKWQWSWLVKSTKQIKVDRNSKDKSESLNKAIEYLKQGRAIGIFPEGTRSSDGKLGKFYNGAVRIAKNVNVPIIPVGIKGAFEIMSRFDKYPKLKKCDINIGKKIVLNDLDENDLTERLRSEILNLVI